MGKSKETLTKSAERVRKYGEVFTPEWVVKKMCDELPADAFSISKTFLEPACGTGNFLVEVFRRKLENCKTASEGLQAMESIYGVDILLDNVKESRERLLMMYHEHFQARDGFTRMAMQILNRNIIRTDFLKIADTIKSAENWNEVAEYAESEENNENP